MEKIIEITFLAVLYATSVAVYVWLISFALPRLFFGITYDTGTHLGRGLKKIKYPDGRAVLYEPHPSVRKYMDKYLLFTVNGCKYFQSRVNKNVSNYKLCIVSFDNRDRVIDTLEVSESVELQLTHPVQLHHATSYVAAILVCVNGNNLDVEPFMVTRLKRAPFYLALCALATFIQFFLIVETVNGIGSLVGGSVHLEKEYLLFGLASAAISIVCMLITLVTKKKKGVKVVLR